MKNHPDRFSDVLRLMHGPAFLVGARRPVRVPAVFPPKKVPKHGLQAIQAKRELESDLCFSMF